MTPDLLHSDFQVRDYGAIAATFLLSALIAKLGHLPWLKWLNPWRVPVALVPWILLALMAPLPLHWPDPHFKIVMLGLLFILSWKLVAVDIDVGWRNESLWSERLLLIVSCGLSIANPVFIFPNLWVQFTRFDALTHHGILPLRFMIIGGAFTVYWNCCAGMPYAPTSVAPAIVLILVCHAFAYFIAAWTKAKLGPHWYSWVFRNRLHYLIASAYSWGWARFIPQPTWIRLVRRIRFFNVPMQMMAFVLDAGCVFETLHYRAALGFFALAMVFHLVTFLTSGIFFWEWIVANGLLFWFVSHVHATMPLFGLPLFLGSIPLMLAFWLLGPFWRPWPLGWWDTPFTQRIHWEVVGESGKIYGLYNNFLCPRERLYGRVHGYFMTGQKICTYHLGEVSDRDLRDALWASNGDRAVLEQIKEKWGKPQSDEQRSAMERRYLAQLFAALNAGGRKHIFPRYLRWLKAPGGQYFYWGRQPGFDRQEKIARVMISYREEFFDGARYLTVTDQALFTINVPESISSGVVEPTGGHRTAANSPMREPVKLGTLLQRLGRAIRPRHRMESRSSVQP